MPFTDAKRIGDLLNTDPIGLDLVNLGDDEIRSLKSVIQNAFPGFYHLVVAQGVHSGGPDVDSYNVTVTAPSIIFENFAVPLRVPQYFLLFTAASTNAGAVTVQVNGRGYNPVTGPDGVALPAGTIKSGDKVFLWNDGATWYLMGSNAKAFRTGDNYTGAHNFEGATVTVPTAPHVDDGLQVTNQTYVGDRVSAAEATINLRIDNLDAAHILPSQTGHAGDLLGTNGIDVTWVTIPDHLPDQSGQAGKALFSNGSVAAWQSVPNELPPFEPQTDRTILASTAGGRYWTSFTYVPMPPGAPDNQVYHLISQAGDITWTLNTASGTTLPSQSGMAGKVLGTDGTNPQWVDKSPLPSSNGQTFGYLFNNGGVLSYANPLPSTTGHIGHYLTVDANSAYVLTALTSTLPSQSGQVGKVLYTDGNAASWKTVFQSLPVPALTGTYNLVTTGGAGGSASWQIPASPFPDFTSNDGRVLGLVNGALSWVLPPTAANELPDQTNANTLFLKSVSGVATWASPFPSFASQDGRVLGLVSGALAWVSLPIGLPSMTSQTDKFLTNNGTNAFWTTITQGDTLPQTANHAGHALQVDANFAYVLAPFPKELPSYTGNDGKIAGLVNGVVTWITPPSAGTTLPSTTGHSGHALQVDQNLNYVLNPFPTELPTYSGPTNPYPPLVTIRRNIAGGIGWQEIMHVPSISDNQVGFFLKAAAAGDSTHLGSSDWVQLPKELPVPATTDNGKYVGVAGGAYSLLTIPAATEELPRSATPGYVLTASATQPANAPAAVEWKAVPAGYTLPSQTDQAGKALFTNGTVADWGSIPTELPSIASDGSQNSYVLTVNGQSYGWANSSSGIRIIRCTSVTQNLSNPNKVSIFTGITGFVTSTAGYGVQFTSPFSTPPLIDQKFLISIDGSQNYPLTDAHGVDIAPNAFPNSSNILAYFDGTQFRLFGQAPLPPITAAAPTNNGVLKVLATVSRPDPPASTYSTISDNRVWVDPRQVSGIRWIRNQTLTIAANGTDYSTTSEFGGVVPGVEPFIYMMLTSVANTGIVNLSIDGSASMEVHSKDGVHLTAGNFSPNNFALIYYNGIQLFLLNPSQPAAAAVVLPPIATMSVM